MVHGPKLKIAQSGMDGFGHQFEGTLRIVHMALNDLTLEYAFDLKKPYGYEHSNHDTDLLVNYIRTGYAVLKGAPLDLHEIPTRCGGGRLFESIRENDVDFQEYVYLYDGTEGGQSLPINFRPILQSCPRLRRAFVDDNPFLPPPTFSSSSGIRNIVCHLRLNDAVNTRVLDTDMLIRVVRYFQEQANVQITIHSDGDVASLSSSNTIIQPRETDVLQVMSDFIHADILIMNYSGLSIAAHLLGREDQKVICPSRAGNTFFHRILPKCVRCDHFLENPSF